MRTHRGHSINDYGIESINSKSDTLYEVVKGFIADGVPIDAIGFQCHFTLGQIPTDLEANLQRFAALGLDVAVTELDINLRGPANATALAQQAKDYWSVVHACVSTQRCVSVVSGSPTPRIVGRTGELTARVRRACGACPTITRGSRMERSSRGMPRSSPSRRFTRSQMRSRASRSPRWGRDRRQNRPVVSSSCLGIYVQVFS